MHPTRFVIAILALQVISFIACSPAAHAQATCGSSTGADVIVGEMAGWIRYGTIGVPPNAISGFMFGTTSCNFGNQTLPWIGNSINHPVIGMNFYRLKNHRFEQIGMSWVKHGWAADHDGLCCTCINPNNFYALGIGCSDTYDAGTNGNQAGFSDQGNMVSGLGPRSDINPVTGALPWPYTTQGVGGDVIYKRLQINDDDINPTLNPGALNYAECQYISPNEPAANAMNNVSYKQAIVVVNGAFLGLTFNGQTIVRQKSAIQAWAAADPTVSIVNADVPGDGRFMLGSRVSSNGNGTWHYEYALYNMNSDRSAQSFTVPSPAEVLTTNVGFHDVAYHSGEIYDGTDWPQIPNPTGMQWATTPFARNANANALRWGTLYNFRFDADSPPRNAEVTLGLFKPGAPENIAIASRVPARHGDANGDNTVNVADLLVVITSWGACPGAPAACPDDLNGDGQVNIADLLLVITNWG